MTDLKQAAQQALEALDCVCNERTCDALHHRRNEYHAIGEDCPAVKRLWAARRNLSEALAAPQPEPVAFYDFGNHRMRWAKPTTYDQLVSVNVPELPLYTHPPHRQPLRDEELDDLSRTMVKGNKSVNWLCRAIEKAHGIGGAP